MQQTMLFKVPYFVPALAAVLLALLAEAMAGSYMALLAVQKIGMSPLELTVFLTVGSASGILATSFFGHLHDRRPHRGPLFLSLAAKVLGFALCAIVTTPLALIAIAALVLGLSSASYALLFAVAQRYLDEAGERAVASGMAALRLASSLGWAIGPALAALLVSFAGIDAPFWGGAMLGVAALVTVSFSGLKVRPGRAPEPEKISLDTVRAVAPIVLALSAFHTAMFMGSNAMSIVVAGGVGAASDVGWLFSICAALEVVVMGAFVAWPPRRASRALLLCGFLLFAAYFVVLAAVPSLPVFYAAQILRATGIGIASIVGMAFVQEHLPGRSGVAAALFGNTFSAGALLSGLTTGTLASLFGWWAVFWVSAGFCGLGAVLLLIPPRRMR